MNLEKQEHWVFRVLVRRRIEKSASLIANVDVRPSALEGWWLPEEQRPPTMQEAKELRRLFEAGAIFEMPDGALAEPMEVFDEEAQAREHRAKLLRERPLAEFKVILNAGDAL